MRFSCLVTIKKRVEEEAVEQADEGSTYESDCDENAQDGSRMQSTCNDLLFLISNVLFCEVS